MPERLLSNAAREQFKYEVAQELGLRREIEAKGWAEMPSRQLGRIGGKIGGNMVKVMIQYAEQSLADGTLRE